ncbi:hypothetical protein PE074_01805 [Wohlfahrtiimonas chitiniclastica]|uniref:hypothetical protein n=1 Tax=Wohlfahrtiimonas chitiniclastica TaxID=400946 RepID=UPI002157E02B|nr:hypothetical protein [Wohlfahrtiimonas chitiniclastica]MDC7252073.1 hypothetical protein [Wohlfahrtiimonas chitiniclastica]WHR55718.1 hypothetical protein PE074_01805 [Wohlfahrtiimonas chitiniclastica]
MAIPIIIGVAAAAIGAYKGGKAISDNSKAKELNESAERIAKNAERMVERSRENCETALTDLGQAKVDVLDKNVQNFLEVFNQIKNVDFEHDGDFGNLHLNGFDQSSLAALQAQASFIATSGLGAAGGAVSGALVAYGAYSGTMMFAAASTGTAISTLSGAAATNATLAWLGGGSLAAGGGGIAAGTLALGALAAGPAILVAGWYMGSKASKNLDDAHSNKAEARRFEADMEKAASLTNGIADIANKLAEVISNLRKFSRRNVNKLQDIIDSTGNDFRQYSDDERMIVMKNLKIMQLIKVAIDTPILGEDGSLLGDAESNILSIGQQIESIH